jgi:hypothetical protein
MNVTLRLFLAASVLFLVCCPQLAEANPLATLDLSFADLTPQDKSFGPPTKFPEDVKINAKNIGTATWTDFHIGIKRDPKFPNDNLANVKLDGVGTNPDGSKVEATGQAFNFSPLNIPPGQTLTIPGNAVTFDKSLSLLDPDSSHFLLTSNPTVPEPTTLLLFGTTAAALGLIRWRRRSQG